MFAGEIRRQRVNRMRGFRRWTAGIPVIDEARAIAATDFGTAQVLAELGS